MSDWYCHTHGIKDCECYEADLVKRIAELEAEVERLTADGIHTCHAHCQRPMCVMRRRQAKDREAMREVTRWLNGLGELRPDDAVAVMYSSLTALAKRLEE